MFGRSGQMFPRRAYHDAVYEEEYTSESEEDCCRGRGVAGVFCWCFSVILLLGLAASLILTVFFVLKSRNLMGGSNLGADGGGDTFDDIDILYGFDSKFDKVNDTVSFTPVTTEMNHPEQDFNSTSNSNERNSSEIWPIEIFSSTPTPPTQEGVYGSSSTISRMSTTTPVPSTTTTSSPVKVSATELTDSDTINGVRLNQTQASHPISNYPRRVSSLPIPSHIPGKNKNMSSDRWKPILPETTVRTVSSEENLSTTSHAHVLFSLPPSSAVNLTHRRRRPNRKPEVTKSSTTTTTTTQKSNGNHVSSSVEEENRVSNSSLKQPRPDLLEEIIKNLAPKFKNTTEIFSSNERFIPKNPKLRVKTMIRTRTTSPAPISLESSEEPAKQNPDSSLNPRVIKQGIIEEVDPPNFVTTKRTENVSTESTMSSNEFMDILVGNEDQKRLITKETETGLITSAMLPSWFVNNTGRENVNNANAAEDVELKQTNDFPPVTTDRHEESGPSFSSTQPTPVRYAHPGLGQFLMNMFSSPTTEEPDRVGTVLENSEHPVEKVEETNRQPSFKDLLKGLSPMLPASTFSPLTNSHSGVHYDDGKLYGSHDHELIHHHHPEAVDDSEMDEDESFEGLSPSHIIDIEYDRKHRPEIVIEPGGGVSEMDYADATHIIHHHIHQEPLTEGSHFYPRVIPPPFGFNMGMALASPLNNGSTTPEYNVTSSTTPGPPKSTTVGVSNELIRALVEKELAANNVIQEQSDPTTPEPGQLFQGLIKTSEKETKEPEIVSEAELDTSREEISDEVPSPHQPESDKGNIIGIEGNLGNDGHGEEDDDYIIERKPVRELDGNLFKHPPSTQLTPSKNPIQSEAPVASLPSDTFDAKLKIPEAEGSETPETTAFESPEDDSNSSGFMPPEPIDFHSSFRPSVTSSSGGFLPMESGNWRPLVYKIKEDSNQQDTKQNNAFLPTGPSVRPNSNPTPPMIFPSDPDRTHSIRHKNIVSSLPTFSEALKLRPTTTGSEFDQSIEASIHWPDTLKTVTKKSPISPSRPIPTPPLGKGIRFPTRRQEQAQQSSMIDRSKYMRRPAPPPILMRRNPKPPQPSRRKTFRHPPYLSRQQQIQQQRMLKERLYHQRMNRFRLQHREGGGNLQWPNEQPIRRNGR